MFIRSDCNCGYWQVEIREEDRDKTIFTSPHGMERYTRMPFGLKNGRTTFQWVVDVILTTGEVEFRPRLLIWRHNCLQPRLETFWTCGKGSEPSICCRCHIEIKEMFVFRLIGQYIGHIIRPGKLEVCNRNCDALTKALPPTNGTELRSFSRMCHIYRRLVPNFARIDAPLKKRTAKWHP